MLWPLCVYVYNIRIDWWHLQTVMLTMHPNASQCIPMHPNASQCCSNVDHWRSFNGTLYFMYSSPPSKKKTGASTQLPIHPIHFESTSKRVSCHIDFGVQFPRLVVNHELLLVEHRLNKWWNLPFPDDSPIVSQKLYKKGLPKCGQLDTTWHNQLFGSIAPAETAPRHSATGQSRCQFEAGQNDPFWAVWAGKRITLGGAPNRSENWDLTMNNG